MKILLLLLLIFNLSFSQVLEYKFDDNTSVEIDKSLKPPVDDLKELFIKNKLDLKRLGKIQGIYIKYYDLNLGATDLRTDIITINCTIPPYLPTLIKAVLFHEVAHVLFGINHDDNGPYLLKAGPDMELEKLIEYWDYYETEYVFYLKQNL